MLPISRRVSAAARSTSLLTFVSIAAAGCVLDNDAPISIDEHTDSSHETAVRARIQNLVQQGALNLDLAEASDDLSVQADVLELVGGTLQSMRGMELDSRDSMSVEYLGKGRSQEVTEVPSADPKDPLKPADDDSLATSFDAFNPATGNEFRITLPSESLAALGAASSEAGVGLAPHDMKANVSEDIAHYSWSNGSDDRVRAYGVNAPVTHPTHRRLVHLSNGCSGTLVGPRHVVTAAHCLWSRDDRAWANNFWVRAGRNGNQSAASVFIDNRNIPGGQVLWYFTPSQYRATSGSTWGHDFGLLVLPSRLGDVVGWLGYVALSDRQLEQHELYRRGYPACTAFTRDGTPRTDEPSPCRWNHLYKNAAPCNIGELESRDGRGWHRVLHHSCDASGGDSGSSLYTIFNGVPAVAAIHFVSRCETTEDGPTCKGSLVDRPLAATRITPEYRDIITYFRNLHP